MTVGRLLPVAALAVAVVAAVVLLSGGGAKRHRLYAVLPDATNVVAGQWIRVSGVRSGRVASIKVAKSGSAAKLALDFDDSVWPLTQGTSFQLRQGGTVSYANRYIEVRPGPADGQPLGENSTISPDDFEVPVEFDGLLKVFTQSKRAGLKNFLEASGPAMQRLQQPLRHALLTDRAPAAVTNAGAFTHDLDSEGQNIRTLVESGDRVIDAAQRANPQVGTLITGAAQTFTAIADEARNVQQTLERTPATLDHARTTLAHASTTLAGVNGLTREIDPGVTELRRIAAPLTSVLTTLRDVGPDARITLNTLRTTAPTLNPLLAHLQREMPRLSSIGAQGAKALNCIRPYSPEIAGFFSNWASFTGNDDGRNRALRLGFQTYPYSNATPLNSAQITSALPQLSYAFPRPPGYDGGQPWFLEECGAGKDALDPAKDPLARDLNLGGRDPVVTNQDPEPAAP